MFIEQRLVNNSSGWQRLPYAVSGESWTSTNLVAGGTYEFRLAPSKGKMTGIVGPPVSTFIASKPIGVVSSVSGSAIDSQRVAVNWAAATNASGYLLSQRILGTGTSPWATLPYPVSGTTFTFGVLDTGRHYDFGVTPNRGYANGIRAVAPNIRTRGLPYERAYAALGDSYSSGLGSTQADATGCHRSPTAWAHLMQPALNAAVALIACAGAVIDDVSGSQIAAMQQFFDAQPAGRPELVTLTIGGNDAGFSDILQECASFSGDCLAQESSYRAVIDGLQSRLTGLYAQIVAALPYSDIIVGGYPGVLEIDGNSLNAVCHLYSREERALAHRLAIRLNNVVSIAASGVGIWSVGTSVYDTFYPGHNACALNGSWINSPDINLSSGQYVDPASFHPNDAGQIAYSSAFGEALSGEAQ